LSIERRVEINRQARTPLVRADPLSEKPIDALQIAQVANLKGPQKLTRRSRGENRLDAEEFGQPRIATQDSQIEQTRAAEQRIPAATQDVLRLRVAALALLEMKVVIKHLRDAQFVNEVAQEDDPSVRCQPVITATDLELESFADYGTIHLTGDSFRSIRLLIAPLFYAVLESPVAVFKEL